MDIGLRRNLWKVEYKNGWFKGKCQKHPYMSESDIGDLTYAEIGKIQSFSSKIKLNLHSLPFVWCILKYNEINLPSFLKGVCFNEVISTTDYLFTGDINLLWK